MVQVLVVDDELDIRDLLECWLHADGHEVLAADSAETALAAVGREGLPQAVVLDVDMPGIDGVELLARLRERAPGLPALFVTVLWDARNRDRMRDAGGVVLPKPFRRTQLCTAVRQLTAGTAVARSEQ
ncbi:response regulator [Krasilnikovia sp. MM14-A1259]|uniref:response regulator n=1 Tax=Krasilnikovia sp. MM14-A1259 TaxID=3373539 RepID=UPI003825105A